jgi:hypothetical protein
MSDSWEAFIGAIDAEAASMAKLHKTALVLTRALVQNEPQVIRVASEELEVYRKQHLSHAGKRRSMQRRGFGRLSLREVCKYAPRAFQPYVQNRLAELYYYVTSLRISHENNRALVIAGMERLLKVVEVLRAAQGDQSGTYKRRGIAKKKDSSVIVSQQA